MIVAILTFFIGLVPILCFSLVVAALYPDMIPIVEISIVVSVVATIIVVASKSVEKAQGCLAAVGIVLMCVALGMFLSPIVGACALVAIALLWIFDKILGG